MAREVKEVERDPRRRTSDATLSPSSQRSDRSHAALAEQTAVSGMEFNSKSPGVHPLPWQGWVGGHRGGHKMAR